MKNTICPTQTLLEEIHTLRIEMMNNGTTKGLNNDKTIELSQRLDAILNRYQLLKSSTHY